MKDIDFKNRNKTNFTESFEKDGAARLCLWDLPDIVWDFSRQWASK